MEKFRHSRSVFRFTLGGLAGFIFISFLLCTLPLTVSAEKAVPKGLMETLDGLDLKPEDRELLLKQEHWLQELFVGSSQKEADACISMLKNPGRIKFACMAPMGTTWAKYIKNVPKLFRKKCGNIINLDAYIGLSLGNDPDYVRKMAAGALESAGMTSWGMKYISKEMGVYELPFLFETYGEADYVMAKSWPYFVKKFEEKGFTLVPTNFEVGFLQIFSTNMIAKLPEDLKGTKYGSWMEKVEIETLKKMDVNPVVITITEVPSSLATGIIQTGSAPTMYMIGAQLMSFIEMGGGCSGINMFYPPGGLVYKKKNMEKAILANVSRKDKKYLQKYIDKAMEIFEEVLVEAGPKMAHELRESNKKLLAHLQKQGMKLYVPTKEEREIWKKATRPIYEKLVGKVYSREILDLILKYKAEYRVANPDEFENYQWVP